MGIIEEGAGVSGSEERKQFVEGKYQEFLEENEEALDIHSGEEPYFSMTVNLSNYYDGIIKERTVEIEGLGVCNIDIYKIDGDNIPHFHLRSKNPVKVNGKKKKFDSCVKLHRAEFYPYSNHTDTFRMLGKSEGEKAAKSLNAFLCSPDKNTKSKKQMWAILRDEWLSSSHKDVRNLMDMDKPNYNNCMDGNKKD